MKHKILAIILILLIAITFSNSVRKFCYKLLINTHILKACYKPQADFLDIFAQENFDYMAIDKDITESSLVKIAKPAYINEATKIPRITHNIYFTPQNIGQNLPDFYLATMEANFNQLNMLGSNWQHYIWTNNPNLFPNEITAIQGVEIHTIAELQDHILYPALAEAVEQGNDFKAHFAEASDLLRFMVVQKFGGIYNDMDYEIYNAASLYRLMKQFDFIGGRELAVALSYYGNAFFAATANHPVLNEAIMIRIRNWRNEACPAYIKYPCNLYDEMYFNGPPLMTLAYFAKNNIDGNDDIIVPAWMIFNVSVAHMKNLGCQYTKLTKAQFIQKNQDLPRLLNEFSKQHNVNADNIIGADMFCGGWSDKKISNNYHWNWND